MVADKKLHDALYWRDVTGTEKIQCVLCPFNCVLVKGKVGLCHGKQNIDGKLYATNYGKTTALACDPIEKKPLYNFYPGTRILSAGPNGCNLRCSFCQNWQISQETASTIDVTPNDMVASAQREGAVGIAYTYTEPLIWFEFVLDTAKAAKTAGLKNVLVTNGLINEEPLKELLPFIDAMNVDIKSMDNGFYKKICKGTINPVLETVKMSAKKTHVEVTNLVIPGLNDTDEMFEQLTDFLADINPLIPLHFSRYHPDFQLSNPVTQEKTLYHAADIARQKLKHVYIGNIASDTHNQTACPACGKLVVERAGYTLQKVSITGGLCNFCGSETGVVTG